MALPPAALWIRALTFGFALMLITVVVMVDLRIGGSVFVDLRREIPGGDKTVHFVLMGTMAFLLNLLWQAQRVELGPWAPLRGSLVVAIVVALEELSQLFIRSRSFSLEDLAYDYLGIVSLGQLAVAVVWRQRVRARAHVDGGADAQTTD